MAIFISLSYIFGFLPTQFFSFFLLGPLPCICIHLVILAWPLFTTVMRFLFYFQKKAFESFQASFPFITSIVFCYIFPMISKVCDCMTDRESGSAAITPIVLRKTLCFYNVLSSSISDRPMAITFMLLFCFLFILCLFPILDVLTKD